VDEPSYHLFLRRKVKAVCLALTETGDFRRACLHAWEKVEVSEELTAGTGQAEKRKVLAPETGHFLRNVTSIIYKL